MIPKQAIENAIEGGWKFEATPLEMYGIEKHPSLQAYIALNPAFWKALGKALGWKGTVITSTTSKVYKIAEDAEVDVWFYYAHAFYDLILTGGDTEKFWEELLK